ncbi:MAG: GtrA family protein [Ferruginibacter sp.]
MYPFLLKMIKFGLVGLFGMVIDFGATWLCKEKLKWNKYIANGCGFTLAVISNYSINRHWTFTSNNPLWVKEFIIFLTVSLIGLLLNTIFLYFFHHKKDKNFYIAKFMAILVVFIWNFLANYFFNFK